MDQKRFVKDLAVTVAVLALAGFVILKNSPYSGTGSGGTDDWKIYKNMAHHYEFAIPRGWGTISQFDGGFDPEVSPAADGFVLGDRPYNELVEVNIYNSKNATGHSADWYVDFYVGKTPYQKKVVRLGNINAVELYIDPSYPGEANRYAYLIEKRDALVVIGFFNKSGATDRILSSFEFLD